MNDHTNSKGVTMKKNGIFSILPDEEDEEGEELEII
jgi:hypothetical protein